MDALTVSILSSAAYDILKTGAKFTATSIKSRLKNWILEIPTAEIIAHELENLNLSDELSEKAIQRLVEENAKITGLLQKLQPAQQIVNITQNHSGSGDNVGGNKNC
jgi:hypothetical protein